MAATLFGSPPFLSHPITTATTTTRSVYLSSAPPPTPSSESTETPPQQLSAAIAEQPEPISLKGETPKPLKPANKIDSTDWIATSLTRRFGLAWAAAFLAVGVVSEQIKTRPLEVSQEQASTRYLEEEQEVVLPNGIRYYDVRVGGGASPRPGDLVVIDLKGKVMETGEVFVDTSESNKKPLALVMESRPYSKGLCEGVEYAVRSMRSGGKRRVIVPSNLGFREKGADLGSIVKIPPLATLEYIVQVSIAPA